MKTTLTAEQVLERQRIYKNSRKKPKRIAKPFKEIKREKLKCKAPIELNTVDIWLENQRLKPIPLAKAMV